MQEQEILVERIALRPDVVSTVVDDGAVLLDLQSKYFYTVNRAGVAILTILEDGASRGEILRLCEQWGMPAMDIDSVTAFIDVLADDDLVEAIGPGALGDSDFAAPWERPVIEKQREPLQRIMASAFDPSLPLAE